MYHFYCENMQCKAKNEKIGTWHPRSRICGFCKKGLHAFCSKNLDSTENDDSTNLIHTQCPDMEGSNGKEKENPAEKNLINLSDEQIKRKSKRELCSFLVDFHNLKGLSRLCKIELISLVQHIKNGRMFEIDEKYKGVGHRGKKSKNSSKGLGNWKVDDANPFWDMVQNYIKDNGPLPPVYIFRHAYQVIYSSTKGGVDGSTRFSNEMSVERLTGIKFEFERKYILWCLIKVMQNGFYLFKVIKSRYKIELANKSEKNYLNAYKHTLSVIQRSETFKEYIFSLGMEILAFQTKSHFSIDIENFDFLPRLNNLHQNYEMLDTFLKNASNQLMKRRDEVDILVNISKNVQDSLEKIKNFNRDLIIMEQYHQFKMMNL